MDMQNLEVEIGFKVAKKVSWEGEILAGVIPSGKKPEYLHKGSYRDMNPVYEAMANWICEKGLQPTGTVYEFYLRTEPQ